MSVGLWNNIIKFQFWSMNENLVLNRKSEVMLRERERERERDREFTSNYQKGRTMNNKMNYDWHNHFV